MNEPSHDILIAAAIAVAVWLVWLVSHRIAERLDPHREARLRARRARPY